MRDAQNLDVLTAPRRGGLRVALTVAAVVALVDQATKIWALRALEPTSCTQEGACIDLFAGARFHLVFNTGASFSRGTGFGPVLAVIAAAMTGVLLYMASQREDRWGAVLFGAIAGGAVGNLTDRIYRADDGLLSGAVVDFIDLGWWPVFNVADSAIVGGVIAMVVLSLFTADDESSSGDGADLEPVDPDASGSEKSGPDTSGSDTSDRDSTDPDPGDDVSTDVEVSRAEVE